MLDTRIFPPDYRGKYPHMFPLDVAVWERFLDQYGSEYTGFQYDIMVGKKCRMFPRWEESYRRDAEVLSKLRIDVVGIKPSSLDIIEVKPRGNMASVGQILTYLEHYMADYGPSVPVRGLLVCGDIDQNIIPLLANFQIDYKKV